MKTRFRIGQVVMCRLGGIWTPWIVEATSDADYPSCLRVRHRPTEKFLMEPERVRPLTAKEIGPRPRRRK